MKARTLCLLSLIFLCLLGTGMPPQLFGQPIGSTRGSWSLGPSQLDSLNQLKKQLAEKEIDRLVQHAEQWVSKLPDTALLYIRPALKQATALEYTLGMAHSQRILGDAFANFSAYATAADHYFQAIALYQQLSEPYGLAQTHNALGDLYYYTRQETQALEEHEKALAIAEANAFTSLEALTLGYIGHFYEKQLNYQKALEYQHLALDRYASLKDSSGLSSIYGHLGSIYEDLADFDKAFEYFERALEVNLTTGNLEERIVHLNNLGDVFRKQGDYEKSLGYTQYALKLAQKLENKYQEKSAKRDLAKTYGDMGKYDRAFALMQEVYELNEELYDSEGANQIIRMQSIYEMGQAQRELDNLKKDQRIDRMVKQFLVVGLVLLCAVFVLMLSRQRLKSQKDKELLRAEQALTEQELENSRLRSKQLESDLEARATQLSAHALSIVQKNKMLRDLKGQLDILQSQHKSLRKPFSQLIEKIDQGFHFDKDWKKFNQIFEQVHPDFYSRLLDNYPNLSSAEIRLCALLRLKLEPKDMASILGISLDSLRVSRHRLRKKLQLERSTDLMGFVAGI